MKRDEVLTDEEVEAEIERIKHSEGYKLAIAEKAARYRRRQTMYTMRWYEKRGYDLMKQGVTLEDFKDADE